MTTILVVCSIILLISVLGLLPSLYYGSDGWFTLFIIMLFADLVLGFGMIACCGNWKGDKIDLMVPEEIARSQYTMFIKCQGQTHQTSDVRFFSAPDSAIRVERTEGFNAYGGGLGNAQIRLIIVEENR